MRTGRPSGWRAAWPRASSTRASRRRIAAATPRGTPSARPAADRVRAVPAEPRPDRQPRLRRAADRARRPGERSGRDRAAAALPADPAAVHGRGAAAGRRSCSSPTITASWRMRCARAGGASSRASRHSPIRRAARSIPDPNAAETFERSCPISPIAECGDARRALYRRLLALRRDASRAAPRRRHGARRAQPIGPSAVLARWRLGDGAVLDDRLQPRRRSRCTLARPAGDVCSTPRTAQRLANGQLARSHDHRLSGAVPWMKRSASLHARPASRSSGSMLRARRSSVAIDPLRRILAALGLSLPRARPTSRKAARAYASPRAAPRRSSPRRSASRSRSGLRSTRTRRPSCARGRRTNAITVRAVRGEAVAPPVASPAIIACASAIARSRSRSRRRAA